MQYLPNSDRIRYKHHPAHTCRLSSLNSNISPSGKRAQGIRRRGNPDFPIATASVGWVGYLLLGLHQPIEQLQSLIHGARTLIPAHRYVNRV